MNSHPLKSLKDPAQWLRDAERRDVLRDLDTGFHDDWLWATLQALELRGVFHVTSVNGWTGIKRDGVVLPNDGCREPMFAKSRTCRGWRLDGVCLFDFESACLELVASQWSTIHGIIIAPGKPQLDMAEQEDENIRRLCEPDYLGREHHPVVIVHFGERSTLPGPWEYWRQTGVDDAVPYVECWHLGPMPLELATAVHVLRWNAVEHERWQSYSVHEARTLELA